MAEKVVIACDKSVQTSACQYRELNERKMLSKLHTPALRAARSTQPLGMGLRTLSSTTAGGFFEIEKRGNVAVVTLDAKGERMNTLSSKMMADFHGMMDTIEGDDSVKAAVVISGKPDNFIAGADITELAKVKTAVDGEALSRDGKLALYATFVCRLAL